MSTHVFATSPAHAPAREARAQIDAAVSALRESTASLDRAGIAARLARAAAGLYVVLDTPALAPAHHDALVDCANVLREAALLIERGGALTGDPARARAHAELQACEARLRTARDEVLDLVLARRADLREPPARLGDERSARPFRASLGVPTLHAIADARLAPRFTLDPREDLAPPAARSPAPPPPQKPTTLDELRAARAAASKPPAAEPPVDEPGPAPPAVIAADGEMVRRVARDCLEDIAALSCLRKPIPSESWLDQSPFEQRMLANLDAFVSFGSGVLPAVTLFHAEAPAPDPPRGFAVALVLGSIEGTAAADVAVAALRESAPEEHAGFVEGFALAPSPALDVALAELLDAPSPLLVRAAVDVLGARGTLPGAVLPPLLARGDASLDLAIARAAGRSVPRSQAIPLLTEILGSSSDDAVFAAACESLLLRGEGAVRESLRKELRARSARAPIAARLLALSGRADDIELLLAAFGRAPVAVLARALGRFGHPGAIDLLTEQLGAEDEPLSAAAAEALDRITGAALREQVEVPWSPDAPPPPDGRPPPMRTVTRVVTDPAQWRAWWSRARGRFDPRVKHRAGNPFAPLAIVDELESPASSPVTRCEAACELVIATGLGARFATTDWVLRQKSHLADLREDVRRLGLPPGAYVFAGAATSR